MTSKLTEDARGVYIIAATPFTDDGALDLQSVDTLTDFYLRCGVHGFTLLGMMGEAHKLTAEESIEVVKRVIELVGGDESLIEYVTDRPGHDRRYSLSSEKLAGLGWQARTHFVDGLARTVDWYRENPWWWEPIRSGDYREYYERHYGRALKS